MANLEHYVNGEYKGSTHIPKNNTNASGWVQTYTSDGQVISTWVDSVDEQTYDDYVSPAKTSSLTPSSEDCERGFSFLAVLWMLTIPIVNIFYYLSVRKKVKTNQRITANEEWVYALGNWGIILLCAYAVLFGVGTLFYYILSCIRGVPFDFFDIFLDFVSNI